MSLDVLHHINGNAIYNLTNPLLLNIISELEEESKTIFNAIPFDMRVSQIILEASTGISQAFIFNTKSRKVDLPNKVTKFTSWWKKYASGYDPVKESKVISNQASMAYCPSDVESASIVHGKKIFLPWNSDQYGVRLIDVNVFILDPIS